MTRSPVAHTARFRELSSDLGIFYAWTDRMRLRDRYAPHACAACGKFDPRAALDAGFDDDVIGAVKKLTSDAFATRDLQDVVSAKLAKHLAAKLPGALQFWPVPKTRHAVALPTDFIRDAADATPRTSVYKAHGEQCSTCGRTKATTTRWEKVRVPTGVHLVGTWSEPDRLGNPNVGWVLNDVAADVLEKGKWAGLTVVRGFYGPNAPFQAKARARKAELNRRGK